MIMNRVYPALLALALLAAPSLAQTAAAPASAPASAPALPAAPTAGDQVILNMREAFAKGDRAGLTALLAQAQGHPLEPWAAYWELKARLEEAGPQEVAGFFTRYAGTYQEDRLRNDWLLLAGQRRDWAAFEAEYPRFRMRDDPQVFCYAVAMDLTLGRGVSNQAAAQALANWLAQRQPDDGCLLAAGLLAQAGKLSPADLWRRARLAMEAGRPALARAAAGLDAPQAAVEVALIQNSAARYLTANAPARPSASTRARAHPRAADPRAEAAARRRQELLTLALIRLACGGDPDQAAAQLRERWAAQLTAEQRNWAWGVIGKQAALKQQDAALGYFAQVTRMRDLNDDMLAWQARAALRQGQWRVAQDAIEAMSGPARADSGWIYWLARARLALAQNDAERESARLPLIGLAGPGGFYEKLAAEELGWPIAPPPAPAPLTAAERQEAASHAGLNRALQALALGMRPEGVREWNYWTNLHEGGGMSDRQLYAAADLACQRQVWDRCINASERTRGFADYAQRFPMPFHDAVLRQAQAVGLDAAYVYGLIRQESRFVMDARSSAGASGLMQLMPATARWTAKKIGLDTFTREQIADRDTNLLIGATYLKLALDEFGGSLPLAAAAYNAGPRRSRAWRNGPALEGAIWVENVPFNETRDYVKKVLSNTTDYAAILTGQLQSLKARLGSVGPPPPGQAPLTPDLP